MLMSRDQGEEMFTWMDKDGDQFVDLLDWNQLISDHRKISDIFVVPHPEVRFHICCICLKLFNLFVYKFVEYEFTEYVKNSQVVK